MLFRSSWFALALTLFAPATQAQDALSELSSESSSLRALHAAQSPRLASHTPKRSARAAQEQRHRKRSAERQRREPRASAVSPQYEELKRSWHQPWTDAESDGACEPPSTSAPLVLHPVAKNSTPVELSPSTDDGGFADDQVAAAGQAFGSWDGGPRVSARLLDIVYHAAQHFQVRHVHLVSGVRHDRGGSRHSHGLAADIVLPGVEDEELAYYLRAQGFVGVGVYTRSGFVHVDVRDKSFFWIDPSPPDRHLKIRPVRAEEARLSDEAALARGSDTFVNPPRLQKALHVRAKRKRAQKKASAE